MKFLIVFGGGFAQASPSLLTYQGRITDSLGKPLEYSAVAFEFIITAEDGLCVLYKEQRNNVNMRDSKGLFDTPIGSGVRSYPSGGTFTVLDAFTNSGTMYCEGGSEFKPAVNEGRRLRVSFFDGVGWHQIRPDIQIRSVPYAAYARNATSAMLLGTKRETDFVLRSDLPVACQSGTEVLSFNGTSLVCVSLGGADLAAMTGVLPVTKGGTGAVSSTGALNNLLPPQAGHTGKILQTNGSDASWADAPSSNVMDFGGVNTATTTFVMKDDTGKFYNFGCSTTGDVPTWTPSGFRCQTTSITETDPKVGVNTLNMLSKWDGAKLVASGVYESGGNVGIGTSNPGQALTVHGRIETKQGMLFTEGSGAVDNLIYLQSPSPGAVNGSLGFFAAGAGSLSGNDGPYFLARGNLFDGISAQRGTIFFAAGNPSNPDMGEGEISFWTGNDKSRMTITNSGNVGVGTAVPDNVRFEVYGQPRGSLIGFPGKYNWNIHSSDSSSSAVGVGGGIGFQGRIDSSTTAWTFSGVHGGKENATPGNYTGYLSFHTRLNGNHEEERMRIDGQGNVGIGTTSPKAKLDVAGEIKFGNTSAACNAAGEGQQRYNSSIKNMEFCNGASWVPFGAVANVEGTAVELNPLVGNGIATQSHGLGAKPSNVRWYLECLSDNNGFVVGDRVFAVIDGNSSSVDRSFIITADGVNTTIVMTASAPFILHKTTAAQVNLNSFLSSWKLVVVPIK